MRLLEALKRDADYATSYPAGVVRDPRGLPLPEVDMSVPVTLQDFEDGREWPPDRCLERDKRIRHQVAARRGDYYPWFHPKALPLLLSLSPIGDFFDVVAAMLLASEPAPGEPQEVRSVLQRAAEDAIYSMLTHGRAIILGVGDDITVVDVRYAWPFADESGWVFVTPRTSGVALDEQPDLVDVLTWVDGVLGGYTARWQSSGTDLEPRGRIGEQLDVVPAESGVMLVTADRPPIRGRWGAAMCNALIPVAVEMARRESGISYVLDRNERPVFQMAQANADTGFLADTGTGESEPLSSAELRKMAPALRQHDVVVLPDGAQPGEYVTWDSNMASSFAFLDHLDRVWTRATGMAPVEGGDSGSVPSGVAVARRNAMLVARNRQLHSSVRDALIQARGGREFVWDYVDTMLASDASTSQDQPLVAPDVELPADAV